MRVLFTRDTRPEEHGPGDGFKKDQIANLADTSAIHWQNLGAAVEAPPEVTAAPVNAPNPEPEPPAAPVPPAPLATGQTGDQQTADEKAAAAAAAAESAAAEAARLAAIKIPPAWKNMPVAGRLDLAKEISGKEFSDKGDADAVIAAEVARREAGK